MSTTTSKPTLAGKWRAVRFAHEKTMEAMSHVEYRDAEGWARVTLHLPDALADEIVSAMSRAEAADALAAVALMVRNLIRANANGAEWQMIADEELETALRRYRGAK